eukprot:m.786588 g.786588  ORF g.786588 m.786588 type:complete len:125 (-) comp59180_c0_seq1:3051-3425(-)
MAVSRELCSDRSDDARCMSSMRWPEVIPFRAAFGAKERWATPKDEPKPPGGSADSVVEARLWFPALWSSLAWLVGQAPSDALLAIKLSSGRPSLSDRTSGRDGPVGGADRGSDGCCGGAGSVIG